MHKGLRCRSVIFLMLFLSMTGASIAADNAPISVSCSIPVVPGLNAPPFNTKTTEARITAQQDSAIENKTPEQPSSTIQEETQEEIILADGNSSLLVTQTVYIR